MTSHPYVDIPLSQAQSGIWLDLQIQPFKPERYNIATCVDIDGALDVVAFKRALQLIVQHASALRTEICIDRDGNAFQRIHSHRDLQFQFIDALTDSARAPEAEQWMLADVEYPFEVPASALYRFVLFRIAPERWRWYSKFHHIIVDGQAVGLIRHRVVQAYAALCAGGQPAFEEGYGPAQYVRYAQAYRQSEQYVEDHAYWLSAPTARSSTTTLFDAPRQGELCMPRQSTELAAAIGSPALVELCNTRGLRLPHVLIAITALFLHRLTGRREVTLGLPTHGRHTPEQHEMIGTATNILPLRITLDPDANFITHCGFVGEAVRAAMSHHQYRGEELMRDLGLNPSEPRPYMAVVNVLRLQGAVKFTMGTARASVTVLATGPMEGLHFFFYGRRESDALTASVSVASPLKGDFDQDVLATCFGILIDSVVANPTYRLSDYPLMAPAVRSKVLSQWSNVGPEPDSGPLFHQMFESVVDRHPHGAALANARGASLSYRTLNACANQLARRLSMKGVHREDVVGVYIPRSMEAVVAFLAILKCGGVYLPLDPANPAARTCSLVEDSSACVLLTTPALHDQLCTLVDPTRIVALDSTVPSEPDSQNRDLDIRGSDLAYLMFTSGSTGKPKGALLEHRGLANLARAQLDEFRLTPGQRVLHLANLTFDASIWEICMALGSGATLHVLESGSLPELPAFLKEQQIEVATMPPAVLAILEPGEYPALHTLISAGEMCPSSLAMKWSQGRRFINAYGPAEATVCATYAEYLGGDIVPIGRPIRNVHIYILNENMEPVPLGITGELFIGGIGVGRAYIGEPQLTAVAFLPDAFGEGRLYRTGDLARWLSDGSVEFRGRIDRQVKVRGARLELGEVETAIRAHAGVANCAVISRQLGRSTRIAAYILLKNESSLSCGELRTFLRARLPDYAMPNTLEIVPELPLTTSGKLDLCALRSSPVEREPPAGPVTTETQRRLAKLFMEALQVEDVGCQDSFFDLGGDSLSALQMLLVIRQEFSLDLQATTFFSSPYVGSLAEEVDRLQDEARSSDHQSLTWSTFFG